MSGITERPTSYIPRTPSGKTGPPPVKIMLGPEVSARFAFPPEQSQFTFRTEEQILEDQQQKQLKKKMEQRRRQQEQRRREEQLQKEDEQRQRRREEQLQKEDEQRQIEKRIQQYMTLMQNLRIPNTIFVEINGTIIEAYRNPNAPDEFWVIPGDIRKGGGVLVPDPATAKSRNFRYQFQWKYPDTTNARGENVDWKFRRTFPVFFNRPERRTVIESPPFIIETPTFLRDTPTFFSETPNPRDPQPILVRPGDKKEKKEKRVRIREEEAEPKEVKKTTEQKRIRVGGGVGIEFVVSVDVQELQSELQTLKREYQRVEKYLASSAATKERELENKKRELEIQSNMLVELQKQLDEEEIKLQDARDEWYDEELEMLKLKKQGQRVPSSQLIEKLELQVKKAEQNVDLTKQRVNDQFQKLNEYRDVVREYNPTLREQTFTIKQKDLRRQIGEIEKKLNDLAALRIVQSAINQRLFEERMAKERTIAEVQAQLPDEIREHISSFPVPMKGGKPMDKNKDLLDIEKQKQLVGIYLCGVTNDAGKYVPGFMQKKYKIERKDYSKGKEREYKGPDVIQISGDPGRKFYMMNIFRWAELERSRFINLFGTDNQLITMDPPWETKIIPKGAYSVTSDAPMISFFARSVRPLFNAEKHGDSGLLVLWYTKPFLKKKAAKAPKKKDVYIPEKEHVAIQCLYAAGYELIKMESWHKLCKDGRSKNPNGGTGTVEYFLVGRKTPTLVYEPSRAIEFINGTNGIRTQLLKSDGIAGSPFASIHSSKPVEFYTMHLPMLVNKCLRNTHVSFGRMKKLDLFTREIQPGFTCAGKQFNSIRMYEQYVSCEICHTLTTADEESVYCECMRGLHKHCLLNVTEKWQCSYCSKNGVPKYNEEHVFLKAGTKQKKEKPTKQRTTAAKHRRTFVKRHKLDNTVEKRQEVEKKQEIIGVEQEEKIKEIQGVENNGILYSKVQVRGTGRQLWDATVMSIVDEKTLLVRWDKITPGYSRLARIEKDTIVEK